MEYCPGGDLYNAIKSGCMVCDILRYCHADDRTIRDIKPENLLLDANGHLKLTDFGVSEVSYGGRAYSGGGRREAHVLSRLPYMAPELFQAVSYDAREVDVWACGIVYYCMIYHGIPWRRATASDANYSAYLEQRGGPGYEPMQRLRGGCRSLLKRILDPDPATRITVPEILEDPWFCSIRCCSAESESFMRSFSPPKAADQDGSGPPRPLNTSLVAREVHYHVPDDVLAAYHSRSRRRQQSTSPV
ncbi:MAG: kinase-like domain-containing protein [Olpidium bornovanus]|uniref:non-specific serine/threonine protein kinase n=1 Tax=Olpidium bornovanus TaxID=278681 RepID=A0A8H7ZVC7_9FUNG|nr:MAG: kinase-like domain-containing protein [Olpidium bornovanus]